MAGWPRSGPLGVDPGPGEGVRRGSGGPQTLSKYTLRIVIGRSSLLCRSGNGSGWPGGPGPGKGFGGGPGGPQHLVNKYIFIAIQTSATLNPLGAGKNMIQIVL